MNLNNKMENLCEKKSSSGTYFELLLSQLNEFRKNEQFTDVILDCGGVRIPAHRAVLAASSKYFAAMFSDHFPESTQGEISLCEMDPHCVELLIQFIYTRRLPIEEDYVQQLLLTASFLQLGNAEDLCAEFMVHHLDASNCLGFKNFGEKLNNVLLFEAAKVYTIMHFQEVVMGEEFLELSYVELAAILSNDKLYMHSDDKVLLNLVRWAEHKPDERKSHLGTLVLYIHPACVSTDVVNSLEILKQEPRSLSWLDNVKQCIGNMDWRIFTKIFTHFPIKLEILSFDLSTEIVSTIKPLPLEDGCVRLAGYRNFLYAHGGFQDDPHAGYFYNIYRDQWYPLKPLEMGRWEHGSVILHDNLYAIGGDTSQGTTATVEWLNLTTNKSYFSEDMILKRCAMCAVASDQALYVMGGEEADSLYSVETFDPRVGRWQALPSMSVVCGCMGTSAFVDDSIYCCKGRRMERFDIRANKWQVIDPWENGECYGILTVDGKLFGVSDNEISRFDVNNNKWLTIYEYPDERDWDVNITWKIASCNV